MNFRSSKIVLVVQALLWGVFGRGAAWRSAPFSGGMVDMEAMVRQATEACNS